MTKKNKKNFQRKYLNAYKVTVAARDVVSYEYCLVKIPFLISYSWPINTERRFYTLADNTLLNLRLTVCMPRVTPPLSFSLLLIELSTLPLFLFPFSIVFHEGYFHSTHYRLPDFILPLELHLRKSFAVSLPWI